MRFLLVLATAACAPVATPTADVAAPSDDPTAQARTQSAAAATPATAEPAAADATVAAPEPEPAATAAPDAPPAITWAPRARPLTDAERAAMTGVSWREGCPVGLDELTVLELAHHTPDGPPARGELIVHSDAADDLVSVFAALWQAEFPITSMRPVRHFGGDDDRSMAADNTSAFNCRGVGGSTKWSEHAYGRAVDVNPLRNPYVRGARVDPPAGRDWLERDATRAGVIVGDGVVVRAFAAIGWKWGGVWRSSKDYQHFSKAGR